MSVANLRNKHSGYNLRENECGDALLLRRKPTMVVDSKVEVSKGDLIPRRGDKIRAATKI